MAEKTNSQLFLDKYKSLERSIRKRYHITDRKTSPIVYLLRKHEFGNDSAELDYCRELRNLIAHNPGTDESVQPSDRLIKLLEKTIKRVENPPLAGKCAILRRAVLCASLEDCVLPIMRKMIENVYTHIPILDDERVVGVFSENTVFSYLADEEIVGIEETSTFKDISAYLPIDAHQAESFRFVGRNTLMTDVAKLFRDAVSHGDRIGLVLVTENGRQDEKLFGILTAWDLAGM